MRIFFHLKTFDSSPPYSYNLLQSHNTATAPTTEVPIWPMVPPHVIFSNPSNQWSNHTTNDTQKEVYKASLALARSDSAGNVSSKNSY